MRGWATEECGGRWLAGVSGAAGGGGAGQRVRQGGVPLVMECTAASISGRLGSHSWVQCSLLWKVRLPPGTLAPKSTSPNLTPLWVALLGAGDPVAWPTACLRPSAGCGWIIPSWVPSCCSPSCGGAAARPGRGQQGGPRGAVGAEGGERGHGVGEAAAAAPPATRRRAARCRREQSALDLQLLHYLI